MVDLPFLLGGMNLLGANKFGMQSLNSIATLKTRAFVHTGSQPENDRLRGTNAGTNFLIGQPSSVNFTE